MTLSDIVNVVLETTRIYAPSGAEGGRWSRSACLNHVQANRSFGFRPGYRTHIE